MKDMSLNIDASFCALRYRGIILGAFTAYCLLSCFITSWLSPFTTIFVSVSLDSMSHSRALISAVYSAILFEVSSPRQPAPATPLSSCIFSWFL